MGAILVAHSKFRDSHEPKIFSGALTATNSACELRHNITLLKPAQPAYERLKRLEPTLYFYRYNRNNN
jgi:hypothetical protein